MLRAEVGMRVRCANKAGAEWFRRERGIGQIPRKICKKRGICGCCALRRTIKRKAREQRSSCTCGTRGPLGRGQSVPFSAQGAYCSAPEPSKALTGQERICSSSAFFMCLCDCCVLVFKFWEFRMYYPGSYHLYCRIVKLSNCFTVRYTYELSHVADCTCIEDQVELRNT